MRVISQPTPNPDALKFLCEKTMREGNKISINTLEECLMVPLAAALLQISGVEHLYFFQNAITVTLRSGESWETLEQKVLDTIEQLGDSHDADFILPKEKENTTKNYTGPLKEIDEILSRTIRPSLQMDGGDLDIIDYTDNVLSVSYQGACTSCPSAISGTLGAIQGILRDEFHPEIQVISV